ALDRWPSLEQPPRDVTCPIVPLGVCQRLFRRIVCSNVPPIEGLEPEPVKRSTMCDFQSCGETLNSVMVRLMTVEEQPAENKRFYWLNQSARPVPDETR